METQPNSEDISQQERERQLRHEKANQRFHDNLLKAMRQAGMVVEIKNEKNENSETESSPIKETPPNVRETKEGNRSDMCNIGNLSF